MTDPLGLIGGVGQTASHGRVGGVGAARAEQTPNFKDILLENINEVNRLQEEASKATEDLLAGRRDDFSSVAIATQKAELAFQMLMQVRNKMMDAYEEIKQFRV